MAKIHVFLAIVAVVLEGVSAVTDDEKKAVMKAVEPLIASCRDEFGYSRDDVNAARKANNIDALNLCYYACIFKKIGFINETGLFDFEVAVEKKKKYVKGEADIKAFTAMYKLCSAVNEQNVSDGAKGCERAKLLLSCFIKERAKTVTDGEKKALMEAVQPLIDGCRDEFGYTRDEVIAAKKAGNIDTLNPCFYACIFKKIGFINEAGLFDSEVAVEKNKKYIKSEDDIKALTAVGKTCTAVNEQSVSDGAKGCERAKLLLSCFIKEKASFSPFTPEA